jgi:hypothetical protein
METLGGGTGEEGTPMSSNILIPGGKKLTCCPAESF